MVTAMMFVINLQIARQMTQYHGSKGVLRMTGFEKNLAKQAAELFREQYPNKTVVSCIGISGNRWVIEAISDTSKRTMDEDVTFIVYGDSGDVMTWHPSAREMMKYVRMKQKLLEDADG
jgi:hypothetical protein